MPGSRVGTMLFTKMSTNNFLFEEEDEYRGTSLTSNRNSLGSYCRPMPRVLKGVLGGSGRFFMGEVPL